MKNFKKQNGIAALLLVLSFAAIISLGLWLNAKQAAAPTTEPGITVLGSGTGTIGVLPYKVKITGADTTANYLQSKLVAGSNITITKNNAGANETLTIASSGGGGGSSPLTTKGDLYTYSSADARLAVGTDGYILSADSTATTGLKWVANSGGSGMAIGGAITSGTAGSVLFVDGSGNLGQDNSGFYYDPTNNRIGLGTATPLVDIDIRNAGAAQQWMLSGATNGAYSDMVFGQGTGSGQYASFIRYSNASNAGLLPGDFIISNEGHRVVVSNFYSGAYREDFVVDASGNTTTRLAHSIGTDLFVTGKESIGTGSQSGQLYIVGSANLSTSNANTGINILNTNSAGYANQSWNNDIGSIGQFLMTGSTLTFGGGYAIIADQANFISTSANGLNFNATVNAPITFTTGGILVGNIRMTISGAGGVNIAGLAGTGTRPVTADASGNLGAGAILPIAGSFSGVGTATTTFTVTIGTTQPGTSYKVNVTPTSALSAALFYVTNKTTTTFDVAYLAGLTGTVTFDWSLFQ